MPIAPSWSDFWLTTVGGGAAVMFLVSFLLKYLPEKYKEWFSRFAPVLVMVLNYIAPNLATWVLDKYPVVDPLAWSAIYFGMAYLAHQIFYKLIQKPTVGSLRIENQ